MTNKHYQQNQNSFRVGFPGLIVLEIWQPENSSIPVVIGGVGVRLSILETTRRECAFSPL